ncbi:MAG: Tim10/DDP family zinc finger-domain-containing protein [Olpidium bornovanus]|uniref:Mitochondrial import inner membrane translocase subunit n=1 Tax=Olpidium bornovanus TaxID=278681 RepID=A0A8H7ZN93_9FUNG|nr:MAG: Tim10/DDP family zinc finger-domain-containing protein [Olpidium bornovanus]
MSAKKDEIMTQVRNELAVANAQELIHKMNHNCFKACCPRPGVKLDTSEQSCLNKCADRYMEAWNIVSKTYVKRVQSEAQQNSFT